MYLHSLAVRSKDIVRLSEDPLIQDSLRRNYRVIVISARAEEARMVAVVAEAGRARVEPENRVRTRNLPSRP